MTVLFDLFILFCHFELKNIKYVSFNRHGFCIYMLTMNGSPLEKERYCSNCIITSLIVVNKP